MAMFSEIIITEKCRFLIVILKLKSFVSFNSKGQSQPGFVRVLELLKSPGISLWHFPGLESPEKLMQVLESPRNL